MKRFYSNNVSCLFALSLLLSAFNLAAQGVTIGASGPPHPSAVLELRSAVAGLLLPRLTFAERNSIAQPAHSLLIFNTDSRCYEGFDSVAGAWQNVQCFCPPAFQPGAPQPWITQGGQVSLFWSGAAGAYGYELQFGYDSLYSQIPSGFGAMNISDTLALVSGLPCGRDLYMRVRALGTCGSSQWSSSNLLSALACDGCLRVGGSATDIAYSGGLTPDGGVIIGGHSSSFGFGGNDFYAVKIGPDNQIQWARAIGGPGEEVAEGVAVLADGSCVLAGFSQSYGPGPRSALVVKLNPFGQMEWSLNFGGAAEDWLIDICQAADGGFYAVGFTTSYGSGAAGGLVAKVSATGQLLWTRCLSGGGNDRIYGVRALSGGGMAVCGRSSSQGPGSTFFVAKLSDSGNLDWASHVGGSGTDISYAVAELPDGRLAVSGRTNSFGAGSYDGYLVLLNANGTLAQTRTYGGSGLDYFWGLFINPQGNIVVAGHSPSFSGGNNRILLNTYDANLNLLQARVFGTGSADYYSRKMFTDGQGGALIFGFESPGPFGGNDMLLIRTDGQHQACCQVNLPNLSQSSGGQFASGIPVIVVNPTSSPNLVQISSGGQLNALCP